MAGDGGERFCKSCNRVVHDLSSLTRRQASDLVRHSPDGLCARISFDGRGGIKFLREPSSNSFVQLVPLTLLGISGLGFQAESFAQAPRPDQVQPAPSGNSCRIEIRVADRSGAVIPGAHVSVQPEQVPSATEEGATGSDGVFSNSISPGHYLLTVQAPGFQIYSRQNVEFACGTQAPIPIDVELEVGGTMGEVVIVDGKANPFQRAWSNTTFFFRRLLHLT